MSVYGLTGPAVVFTLQRHHSPVSSSLMLMGNTRCFLEKVQYASVFFLCFFAWFLQTAPSRPIQQPPLSTKEEVSRGSGEFAGSNISRPPTDQWHRLICQRTNFYSGSSTQTSCSFLLFCGKHSQLTPSSGRKEEEQVRRALALVL